MNTGGTCHSASLLTPPLLQLREPRNALGSVPSYTHDSHLRFQVYVCVWVGAFPWTPHLEWSLGFASCPRAPRLWQQSEPELTWFSRCPFGKSHLQKPALPLPFPAVFGFWVFLLFLLAHWLVKDFFFAIVWSRIFILSRRVNQGPTIPQVVERL